MGKIAALLLAAFLGVAALSGQSIQITSPKAGDQWCRGQEHGITWTSSGAVGAKVVIRLRQGATRTDVAVTENDGSYAWSLPATATPGEYAILIRSTDGTVVANSPAFAITDCGATPMPAKMKLPVHDLPAPIRIPPQPRITEFTVDKATTFFRLNAKNFGGPMKQDAQVVLSLPGGPGPKQQFWTWPKGQGTFSLAGRVFANGDDQHLASCAQMGGGNYCLEAEIRSPEVVGFPYPGLRDMECGIPCWQDLAVSGFHWNSSGKLSFSVGNNGYCPSCAWSYRLYRMGVLVETSPRYGSVAPGSWSRLTAATTMPANAGGSCLFKVEIVPENPGLEKNTANNSSEYRVVPDAKVYDIVISDIKLSGEVEYWEFSPPTSDAYWRLVPFLKNTGNKECSECIIKIQTAIDNGPVDEQTLTVFIGPLEEIPLSHTRWGVRLPVVPYGSHTVTVAVSICPTPMKKAITRPPQG